MQPKIDGDYLIKLEHFIQKYYLYKYNLESGNCDRSNIEEIFRGNSELFDEAISYKHVLDNKSDTGLRRNTLYSRLLYRFIDDCRCAKFADRIYNQLNIRNKKSYFNILTNIKKVKDRQQRLNYGLYCKQVVAELHPELSQLIEARKELSADLGYYQYIDFVNKNQDINSDAIELQCRTFLSDTEYIYKDITKWHLRKYLDLKMEDATAEDMSFLYSSFEFHEYFRGISLLKNSIYSLSELGMGIKGNIKFDLRTRRNKTNSPSTYPVSVPGQIYISMQRTQTIDDNISLLGELGKALFLSSIDIEESFVNKRLIDPITLEIFKELFKLMPYENSWLNRYIKIKTDKSFLQFLALRRLTCIREICTRLILSSTPYQSPDLGTATKEIESIFRANMFFKPNEGILLLDILMNETTPFISFSSMMTVSYLEEFLRNKYDEQWWRDNNTGNEIYSWWRLCAELTHVKIKELLAVGHPDTGKLVGKLEEIF